MKILIVINSLTAGGAERQVVQDANLLIEAGHEVTVAYGKDDKLIPQLNKKVTVICIGKSSEIKAIRTLTAHLRKHRYDIILSHLFWANKVAAASARLTGHKNVVFEHGLGLWRKWYHLTLVRLVAGSSKYVVTSSMNNQKIKIEREGISPKKMRILPNSFIPIDQKAFQNRKSSDVFTIGFAGRFNAVKQLNVLVDMAEIIKEKSTQFKFVLLGDGDTRKDLEAKIAEKELQPFFELTGYVENPQNLLVNFDAFVLPSKREDFSLALLEASSAGLPCVAFDVGGNGEIILNEKTGFVIKPYEIHTFAEKLIWLLEHKEERKKMSEAAKNWVNNEFNNAKRLERLTGLINETI